MKAGAQESPWCPSATLLTCFFCGRIQVDHFAVLESSPESSKQRDLWLRKLHRAHLGKPSYSERGVTEDQYQIYWDTYIEPRWQEHGQGRVAFTCPEVCAATADCCYI